MRWTRIVAPISTLCRGTVAASLSAVALLSGIRAARGVRGSTEALLALAWDWRRGFIVLGVRGGGGGLWRDVRRGIRVGALGGGD